MSLVSTSPRRPPTSSSAAVDADVRAKLDAIRRTHRSPRVLDLFAGCGGLSLGFQRAGCQSLLGIELDPFAARSYATNFHSTESRKARFERHAESRDIIASQRLLPQLFADFGYESPRATVDLIVGGPPCPAFARVGRAKLREVHQHPEAFRHDPRAQLYLPYLALVQATAPVALLMENVPDILNFGGHNLAEEICETLEEMGYVSRYGLLNAASYGVPQMRERFFLVAIHKEAGVSPSLPQPTHSVDFPKGYLSARQVALKHLDRSAPNHFVETMDAAIGLPPAVTVEEALRDLPVLAHEGRGARPMNVGVAYGSKQPSAYGTLMRTWRGFESKEQVTAHVTRSLSERDYRLFKRMSGGDEYPAAHALAEKLFAAAQRTLPSVSRSEYVPPYDPAKFPNKWRKMEPNRPARTLMAHLGKDTYSHIHYDSDQARVISVREAARLQSFPDGYQFDGKMNAAFRQIGNAVPPLLAANIAGQILASLRAGTISSRLA